MNLEGVAALLGVPAATITAVWPMLQERANLARLERVDRVLQESDVEGGHRKLLVDVRNALVGKIAVQELAPRYRYPQWLAVYSALYGVGLLTVATAPLWAGVEVDTPWWYWFFGPLGVGLSIFLVWVRAWARRKWVAEQTKRPTSQQQDTPAEAVEAEEPAAPAEQGGLRGGRRLWRALVRRRSSSEPRSESVEQRVRGLDA
jgi:hypothetical protein